MTTVDRDLFLDSDGNLVEADDPTAAFLWARAGAELPDDADERGYKAASKAANKAVAAPTSDKSEDVDLESLKKADLLALAEQRGVNVPSGATKADLVALLS